jgi:hypothetical protein
MIGIIWFILKLKKDKEFYNRFKKIISKYTTIKKKQNLS